MEFTIGTRVMTDIGEAGVVCGSFHNLDDVSGPVITVKLDNPNGTPTGFYTAREFELKRIA